MGTFEQTSFGDAYRGPPMDSELAALFHEVESMVQMGIWQWDLVTGETWWSRGLYRIYGRAPELGPARDHELVHVHEQDRARVNEAIQRSLDEGPYYARFRLVREDDGAVREVEGVGRTCFEGGRPTRFVGVAFDITERTRASALAEFRSRLLDAVGQGVIATDAQGVILYANQAVEQMFGWRPEELVGQHVVDGDVTPLDLKANAAEIVSTVFAGRSWQGELTVTRRDGTTFPALFSDYPVFDEREQVVGVIGVATDLTRQKQSESAVREGERLYRALFESPGLRMVIDAVDGTVVMINAQAAAYLGVEVAQAVGRPLAELAPNAHEVLSPRFDGVIARGEPVVYEDTSATPEGVRCYVTNITPVELGGRTLIQLVSNEITALRRTELALRESERQRLRALEEKRSLYEKAPAMIHSIDARGRLIMVSDYWLDTLGYTRAEVIGRPSIELVAPSSRADARRSLAAFFATGAIGEVPLRLLKKSGEVMDVLLSATSETNERGEVVRSFAVLTDMTAQRRLEGERPQLARQLEYAQKLESLGVLAGGIAHDFNNLLTVILGNVELVDTRTRADAPTRKYLKNIYEATRRAASLAGEMLAYSGKGAFVVAPLDVSSEVEAIMNLLQTAIAKTTTLEYQLARGLPPIMADAAQIQQVIMNLVTNASEALSGEAGVVAVRTFARADLKVTPSDVYVDGTLRDGPYVCLEVRDDGCGMDLEAQRRMFDPFYTTKASGRGLGLAALQGIVRGHGGAVIVKSAPARGTVISVCLPAAKPEEVAAARSADSSASRPRRAEATHRDRDGRVLIVDDELEIRLLGQEMIRSFGYETLAAADGKEALELFSRHRHEIAVVLLDLTMPNMSGERTFTAIRALDPKARIILTSGYTDDTFVESVIGTHAVAFIPKPFRLARLQATIEELARRE